MCLWEGGEFSSVYNTDLGIEQAFEVPAEQASAEQVADDMHLAWWRRRWRRRLQMLQVPGTKGRGPCGISIAGCTKHSADCYTCILTWYF
jgi:hypothetical protein